jgi:hypothetical protein
VVALGQQPLAHEPPGDQDEADTPPTGDGVIRVEYDWTATEPGTAVVETVAIASDREPQGLKPPSATVDSDALNTFIRTVESAANVEPSQTVQVADRVVTLHGGSKVAVRSVERGSGDAEN